MELGINTEAVLESIPKIRTLEDREKKQTTDTSISSKNLLCPVHIERLITIIERMGDKASMKTLLRGKNHNHDLNGEKN